MKNKLITVCARKATRIGGSLTQAWKRAIHRAFRRQVRQTDHLDEDANYEPNGKRKRITGHHVI